MRLGKKGIGVCMKVLKTENMARKCPETVPGVHARYCSTASSSDEKTALASAAALFAPGLCVSGSPWMKMDGEPRLRAASISERESPITMLLAAEASGKSRKAC